MYSSLAGVDVTHKLHWTPGETVRPLPLVRTPFVGVSLPLTGAVSSPGLHSSYHQHGVRVVSGLLLPQLLPHLHQGLPGSPPPTRPHHIRTSVVTCTVMVVFFFLPKENKVACRSGLAEPALVRRATVPQPHALRILPAAGRGPVGGRRGAGWTSLEPACRNSLLTALRRL